MHPLPSAGLSICLSPAAASALGWSGAELASSAYRVGSLTPSVSGSSATFQAGFEVEVLVEIPALPVRPAALALSLRT